MAERWVAGLLLGAGNVQYWLLSMWPNAEFDFGSPHLQTEKIKRARLNAVWILVILPVLTTLVYDLAKARGILNIH